MRGISAFPRSSKFSNNSSIFLPPFADDVSRLLAYGAVLGWLAGVTEPRRAQWLFLSPVRSTVLLLVFFCTPPVFAAIGEVPGLQVP